MNGVLFEDMCLNETFINVNWSPSHDGMIRPAYEADGLQIYSIATNILHKQWRSAEKGWIFSLSVGRSAKQISTIINYHVTRYYIGRRTWIDLK
jgi:hypothetical protein